MNAPSLGDGTTPLLMAIINGHFDLATTTAEKGASPNTTSMQGVGPLYGVLNIEWAPKALYPQPQAQQAAETRYLDC